MSDHEFEKQVRQKLNDLKLSPTSKVWENIEENLRERKRRPAVIYWLPLLLIGLAAGGYWVFNDVKVVRETASGKGETVGSRETANGKRETVGSRDSEMSSRTGAITPREGSAEKVSHLKAPQANFFAEASLNEPKSNHIDYLPEDALQEKTVKELKNSWPNFSTEKNISFNNSLLNLTKVVNRQLEDSKHKANDKRETAQLSLKTKKSNKSTHWSYGISASAGVSAVNEGKLLGFNNAQVEDVSIVAPFAPSPTYKPSTISPGFAYSTGVFAKRDLSKKFSLSFGLNYLQLNTRNKVGYQMSGRAVVNSGNSGYLFVSNYFTIDQDNTTEYRNRYHFIELPIELHTSINHSKKLPINITTGIAVSRLMKSNSLHFDGTTGVYYQNDKLLKRTQVAAKAGLTFGVLNKTKRPLSIGPSMNYNISKILKKDVSTRKNFMSFGVDARMLLRR